jgi:hypothetical protein
MFRQNKQRGFPSLELGAVWYAVPVLWVCAAVAGWVLLSGWPTLFAGPLAPDAAAASAPTVVAAPYESSDPSLPSASQVFTGTVRDVGPLVDTF